MKNPLSLTLMVDKSCKRVIYAESNGYFVDILLSLLTIPLGSMSDFVHISFGSFPNLRESVRSLDRVCFFSEVCRLMLLSPLNSPPIPFTADDDYLFRYYYICEGCRRSLSFYPSIPCKCGKLANKLVEFVADANDNEDSCFFIKPSFKFIITDDLRVSQSSTELAIDMFSKMDQNQRSSLECRHVYITPEKILELLKQLMVSDTPLTDVFLEGQHGSDKLQQLGGENCKDQLTVKQISSKRISIKLYLNKKDNTLLFCEAGKEFAELLASFLTYPMGSAINLLGGRSGIQCIDNLYNSIKSMKSADCIKNSYMIQILLEPYLPHYYSLKDSLIKMHAQHPVDRFFICGHRDCKSEEVTNDPNNICKLCKRVTWMQLTLIDPKHCSTRYEHSGEYLKNSLYMITDELSIKQLSSLMVIKDVLNKSGQEITVRNLEIGEDEALALLRASMTSKTVLTDVLLGKVLGQRS